MRVYELSLFLKKYINNDPFIKNPKKKKKWN